MKGWISIVCPVSKFEHVVPEKDLWGHELGMECLCRPWRDDEAFRVIWHFAFDGRDLLEMLENGENII